MPVTVDDVISLSYIDLFEVPHAMPQFDAPVAGARVVVPGDEYAAYRLALCDGDTQPASFVVDDRLFEAQEQSERLFIRLLFCLRLMFPLLLLLKNRSKNPRFLAAIDSFRFLNATGEMARTFVS